MFLTRHLIIVTIPRTCHCVLYGALKNANKRFMCNSNNSTTKKLSDMEKSTNNNNPLGNMSSKYQVFRDQDSEIILDIYEERLKYQKLVETEPETEDPFEGLNLERGIRGVFDIEDLVDVLKQENAEDIFVAEVPNEIKYVDYICVVSAKSQRHMIAIAQFVRRVFKLKRHKGDIVPKLEGENSNDWMALDLGNIALHIFSRNARSLYDLDSLWAVGSKFDDEFNKKDPVAEMLERHSIYLADLEPAS